MFHCSFLNWEYGAKIFFDKIFWSVFQSVAELHGKLEQKMRSLFRRDVVEANNLSYPNKYMRPDFDPQAELKDVVTELPGFLWNNLVVSFAKKIIDFSFILLTKCGIELYQNKSFVSTEFHFVFEDEHKLYISID